MPDGIPYEDPTGLWRFGTWQTETQTGPNRNLAERYERNAAIRALTADTESLLYAFELYGGIIKIGYTTDLVKRHRGFPGCTILAFRPGDRDDERAIHATLRPHRAYGWEHYHPTPEVLAVVNDMRDHFGLPHIEAA